MELKITLKKEAAVKRLRFKALSAAKAGAECGTARSSHTAAGRSAYGAQPPRER